MIFDQYSEPYVTQINSRAQGFFQVVLGRSFISIKKSHTFERCAQHAASVTRQNNFSSFVPSVINVMPAARRAIFNTHVGN